MPVPDLRLLKGFWRSRFGSRNQFPGKDSGSENEDGKEEKVGSFHKAGGGMGRSIAGDY